jgi:hypothetical protein
VGGVTLAFAPYVDLGVEPRASGFAYAAHAGTETGIAGKTDVFGVAAHDAPLVSWTSPAHVEGHHTWPDTARYFGY